MIKLSKRNFKYFTCPVCGKTLINLNTEKSQNAGFHYFWCDVCGIDVIIDENKTPSESVCEEEV